jgi:hypothetical protein
MLILPLGYNPFFMVVNTNNVFINVILYYMHEAHLELIVSL